MLSDHMKRGGEAKENRLIAKKPQEIYAVRQERNAESCSSLCHNIASPSVHDYDGRD